MSTKLSKTSISPIISPAMTPTRDQVEQRKEFLNDLIKTVMKNQKNSPKGVLRVSHSKGKTQYYLRNDSSDYNGRYIPLSEMTFIRKLAQKDYNEKVLKAAEKELMGIDGYLKYLPQYRAEDIYTNLACERQALVTPFFETDEMFLARWESVSYERKGFPDDFPEFLTDRGERVRSKSELIIANLLAKAGVPYRFEYPLYLKGLGLIHPDFMVLNLRLRREFFWEHRGMMDDPGYVENAIRRENCYHLNGFYPGDRLILTSETKASPLNVRQIKEVIEHYLL